MLDQEQYRHGVFAAHEEQRRNGSIDVKDLAKKM
jgi:hypothetical protein